MKTKFLIFLVLLVCFASLVTVVSAESENVTVQNSPVPETDREFNTTQSSPSQEVLDIRHTTTVLLIINGIAAFVLLVMLVLWAVESVKKSKIEQEINKIRYSRVEVDYAKIRNAKYFTATALALSIIPFIGVVDILGQTVAVAKIFSFWAVLASLSVSFYGFAASVISVVLLATSFKYVEKRWKSIAGIAVHGAYAVVLIISEMFW